jgi:hypothetical protein
MFFNKLRQPCYFYDRPFGLEIKTMESMIQSETIVASASRQTYLEKATAIERRIGDIDLKWNWIVVTPYEDSIAKAEGWYVYMGAQREQLKSDLISVKVEQIKNYYEEISKLFETDLTSLNSKISEVKTNRLLLAPEYPSSDEFKFNATTNLDVYTKWIQDFPNQYLDFTNYLENLILSNS